MAPSGGSTLQLWREEGDPFTLFTKQYINIGRDAQGTIGNVFQQGGFAFPEREHNSMAKGKSQSQQATPPAQTFGDSTRAQTVPPVAQTLPLGS